MKKRYLLRLLITIMLGIGVTSTPALAAITEVITFGADLSIDQKNEMASFFGVPDYKAKNIPVLDITNAEERNTLKGLVPESAIGSKAISSAYVKILSSGSGITVEIKNITFVSKEMYANALATAKLKDAKVIAAAPFPVSGTAALTGMFKAFEKATGKPLDPEAKIIANEELVKTGQIGEQIGDKNKASQLFMKVKEQIVADKITDPEKIRQTVINVGRDLNINLTNDQINQVSGLMGKISKLDLNVQDISGQLKNVKLQLDNLLGNQQEVKSLLSRILDSITSFINQIKNWLGLK